MIARIRQRLGGGSPEAGMTLMELLVASAMGVVLMAAVVPLIIAPLRSQPKIRQSADDVRTARFVTERMTHELREGVVVDKASASSVSFQTYVRHSTCGGTGALASTVSATKCEVTYTCSGSSCTRLEAAPGVYSGTSETVFTGLNNSSTVFTYLPSSTSPTYVGIKIAIPAREGSSATTVTDGASLRNATLDN